MTSPTPQVLAARTERPARALIGWMTPEQARLALVGRRLDAVHDDQHTEAIERARAAVEARPPGIDQSDATRPCPAELSVYGARLRAHPALAPYFKEGWETRIVDLRKVCSFQPQVFTDHAAERTEGIVAADLESVASVSLPIAGDTQLPVQFDETKQAFMFASANPNLRVVGHFAGPVGPGTPAFGFIVSVLPSFLQVARFQGRYFLRDGYHRAFGFLSRGIWDVPALVRDFGRTEEMGVPVGMLPQGAYLGERPPMLPDFLDDRVSAAVRIPAYQKLIVIQAIELTPLG
jgi:hypothetical protein